MHILNRNLKRHRLAVSLKKHTASQMRSCLRAPKTALSRTTNWMCVAAIGMLLSHTPLRAQHESEGAVNEGRIAYVSVCANCHGPDGDQIKGIDFSHGQFRRPYSDAQLKEIIRGGLPGTPMPATNMSDSQATRIVEYLRSLSATFRADPITGDASRGEGLFGGKGACVSCHAVNGSGSVVGPDLSTIGSLRRGIELAESIVDPRKEVLPENRFYRVVTHDGQTATGRLLNQDTFTLQLLDTAGHLRSFDRATLREQGFTDTPMPSYKDKLAPQEIADIVSYLSSLKRR
jgi:putative heme-binding domain-containing protein